MSWTCPVCALKLKNPIYPIRCMCGYIADCEEKEKVLEIENSLVSETDEEKIIRLKKEYKVSYERLQMGRLTREEQKKADQLIKELEKEGIRKQDLVKPAEGLGDTIERVLTKFGITQEFVKKVSGQKVCGCDRRKQWLNKLFPYVK